MDSNEIQSLAQEETRIRFGCNHPLNRKVNNREAAFRHRTREGLDLNGAKLRKLWDAFGAGVFGLRGPNRGGLAH